MRPISKSMSSYPNCVNQYLLVSSDEITDPFVEYVEVGIQKLCVNGNSRMLPQDRFADVEGFVQIGLRGQETQLVALGVNANQLLGLLLELGLRARDGDGLGLRSTFLAEVRGKFSNERSLEQISIHSVFYIRNFGKKH